ncbi:Haloacid dehalogenase-like hydrolase [Carpediemonas membranifera]|uniref:Haloacid dehalogenase-like hydrolase n=1 Tax=Carpediemonas membranifera TaxID=201153 RepID=A0A8J6BUQ3_9EUKA|nr:Haloacid dehalogenase-like hydrolase [Carpediemonas membranifera]|eukprot:KAG9390591.1 Haloacid dehalogenase-like hydrolase [Carpediemonas membranifera]
MPSINEYEYYMFDFDGTIFDSFPLSVVSGAETMAKFRPGSPTVTDAWVKVNMGQTLPSFVRDMLGCSGTPATDDEVVEATAFFCQHQADFGQMYARIFDGSREAMQKLKQAGKRISIVTSRTNQTLLPYLDVFGLAEFVDSVVTPDTVKNHKPDPESIDLACEQMGVTDRHAAIMVGDMPTDILAGVAGGVDTCMVGWANILQVKTPEDLEPKPTHIVSSMLDFV